MTHGFGMDKKDKLNSLSMDSHSKNNSKHNYLNQTGNLRPIGRLEDHNGGAVHLCPQTNRIPMWEGSQKL